MNEKELIEELKKFMEEEELTSLSIHITPDMTCYGLDRVVLIYNISIQKGMR